MQFRDIQARIQIDGFPVEHMNNAEFGLRVMGPQVSYPSMIILSSKRNHTLSFMLQSSIFLDYY